MSSKFLVIIFNLMTSMQTGAIVEYLKLNSWIKTNNKPNLLEKLQTISDNQRKYVWAKMFNEEWGAVNKFIFDLGVIEVTDKDIIH